MKRNIINRVADGTCGAKQKHDPMLLCQGPVNVEACIKNGFREDFVAAFQVSHCSQSFHR